MCIILGNHVVHEDRTLTLGKHIFIESTKPHEYLEL